MSINSIVRVSFQSNINANQAVNKALVGHAQNSSGPGPYKRVGTAVFVCDSDHDGEVANAFAKLNQTITQFHDSIDFMSIS